jgi:hypothetical protein
MKSMTYTEASEKLLKLPKEKNVIGGVRKIIAIIAPELDKDILRFLSDRHQFEDKSLINVADYSSNNSYCIIWINDSTSSNYIKD